MIVRELTPVVEELQLALRAGKLLFRHEAGLEHGLALVQAVTFNGQPTVLIERLFAITEGVLRELLDTVRLYQRALQAPYLLIQVQGRDELKPLLQLGVTTRIVLAYLNLEPAEENPDGKISLPGAGKPTVRKAPRKGSGRDSPGAGSAAAGTGASTPGRKR